MLKFGLQCCNFGHLLSNFAHIQQLLYCSNQFIYTTIQGAARRLTYYPVKHDVRAQ